jgi:Mn-dependent DtxR family transcriptional regulator
MELALSLGEATTALVAARLAVSRETAKVALSRLYARGMVERMGAGRGCRYRPARSTGGSYSSGDAR